MLLLTPSQAQTMKDRLAGVEFAVRKGLIRHDSYQSLAPDVECIGQLAHYCGARSLKSMNQHLHEATESGLMFALLLTSPRNFSILNKVLYLDLDGDFVSELFEGWINQCAGIRLYSSRSDGKEVESRNLIFPISVSLFEDSVIATDLVARMSPNRLQRYVDS